MLFGCLLQDKLNTIFKLLIHFKYASWVSKSRKIYSIIDSLTSGGPLDIVFSLTFSTNWNLKICSLIFVSHWFIVYYICIQHSSDLVCLRIGHMSVSKWYIVDREGWICRWLWNTGTCMYTRHDTYTSMAEVICMCPLENFYKTGKDCPKLDFREALKYLKGNRQNMWNLLQKNFTKMFKNDIHKQKGHQHYCNHNF